jgi:hypothetical protein
MGRICPLHDTALLKRVNLGRDSFQCLTPVMQRFVAQHVVNVAAADVK